MKYLRELTKAQHVRVLEATALRDEFLMWVDRTIGPSREASLAKTKIEEAVMWAVEGITAAPRHDVPMQIAGGPIGGGIVGGRPDGTMKPAADEPEL